MKARKGGVVFEGTKFTRTFLLLILYCSSLLFLDSVNWEHDDDFFLVVEIILACYVLNSFSLLGQLY